MDRRPCPVCMGRKSVVVRMRRTASQEAAEELSVPCPACGEAGEVEVCARCQGKRKITIRHPDVNARTLGCTDCNELGYFSSFSTTTGPEEVVMAEITCPQCKGEKTIVRQMFGTDLPEEGLDVDIPCPNCKGVGKVELCSVCHGARSMIVTLGGIEYDTECSECKGFGFFPNVDPDET